MIIETSQEKKTQSRFVSKLKPYVQSLDSRCLPVRRQTGKKAATLGELVAMPKGDVTHVFNNEAMLAISHAIEDLAGEVREGELISTFQNLKNFLPQRKRYVGLSRDLDAVRVWGSGMIPARCPSIDFIPIFRPELERYWIVLFSSPEHHAVLVCRQINEAKDFSDKVFAGFYSFNPFLTESIRRHFNLMSCGLDGVVAAWEKEFRLPSMSLKEINSLLAAKSEPADVG
ncbi:MAG: DICT sensory domain-containing protein [Candidatus Methylacidiphilales bacterium]|nr:DICT sensory domain-containing protein [Candidatus Methylacidiphilales bacterium]